MHTSIWKSLAGKATGAQLSVLVGTYSAAGSTDMDRLLHGTAASLAATSLAVTAAAVLFKRSMRSRRQCAVSQLTSNNPVSVHLRVVRNRRVTVAFQVGARFSLQPPSL